MRSNGGLLLSRIGIGQLRRPFSPSAPHFASFARFYSSHNPIASEEKHGFWHVLKSYLGWNKDKQEPHVIVPEPEAKKSVIERDCDYFRRVINSGFDIVPTLSIPDQRVCTEEFVPISFCAYLTLKIVEPKLAAEIPKQSVLELARTVARDETSKILYFDIYKKTDILNARIQMGINEIAKNWGLQCCCYQILDINRRYRWREMLEAHLDEQHRKRAEFWESRGHVFKY